ncbi:MAG: chitobiase/beta-hexosaminidase C-terminal domain-containing protein [Muribaculaceae bacterium]|nr:chitobiase/beta-hexosaminidase C-terminal domain-containing protein [Muribaculaceae bacterium]
MNRVVSIGLLLLGAVMSLSAAEKSFTISFGADKASTTSLTNATFLDAVSYGKSYIEKVTSVVSVFPETDAVRLSSNKTNGKFNISLAEDARVVAKRIVINAARYDNDRDADAAVMINSETLEIPSITPDDYTIHIPSRPEKTLTNLIVDAEHRLYLYSITVFYDDDNGAVEPEKEQVSAPVITPAGGRVSSGTLASIASETPGAMVFYTVDGSVPTSSALEFTEPFPVYQDIVIKAFAIKEGMNPSETVTAEFSVHDAGAEQIAEFDFSRPESLSPSVSVPEVKEWIELDGRTFTDGDVAVTFNATGTGNTAVRLYHSYDAGTDVRLYDGDSMTIRSLNPNFVIDKAEFVTSLSGGSADVDFEASVGEYVWLDNTWVSGAEAVYEVVLTSRLQSRIASMNVSLKNLSGVEAVDYDHDVKAVFYNLQGVRIGAGAPSPGLYIRISGRNAEKIIVR